MIRNFWTRSVNLTLSVIIIMKLWGPLSDLSFENVVKF